MSVSQPRTSTTVASERQPAMHASATRARLCCDWSTPASTSDTGNAASARRAAPSAADNVEIQNALAVIGAHRAGGDATGRLLARAIIDGNATKFAAAMTLARHHVINLNDPFIPSSRASMLLELVNKPGASRAGIEFPDSDFIPVGRRITAMVAHGANPNQPHFSGTLPLEYAWRNATAEGKEVARALLAAGADPRKQNSDGTNMLHRAALDDNPELIRNWHAAELPADTQTRQDGSTALMFAVAADSREAVDALLASGASPIATASDGQSPYSLALAHLMETGDDRFVTQLQQHALAAGVPEQVLVTVAGMAR